MRAPLPETAGALSFLCFGLAAEFFLCYNVPINVSVLLYCVLFDSMRRKGDAYG